MSDRGYPQPRRGKCGQGDLHISAVAFVHRFGSSLNEHVHFHVCVVDGVFEEVSGDAIFHPVTGIDEAAAALERLLRYCARPPFAMDCLRKEGAALVYRCAKQHSEPSSDKRGARVHELQLTPLALIERIAALVPPPRTHRHSYFGVPAPNSQIKVQKTLGLVT